MSCPERWCRGVFIRGAFQDSNSSGVCLVFFLRSETEGNICCHSSGNQISLSDIQPLQQHFLTYCWVLQTSCSPIADGPPTTSGSVELCICMNEPSFNCCSLKSQMYFECQQCSLCRVVSFSAIVVYILKYWVIFSKVTIAANKSSQVEV